MTTILNIKSIDDLVSVINIESKYKSTYLALNVSNATTTATKYKWDIASGKIASTAGTYQKNIVFTPKRMRNIIGMRMSPTILDFHDLLFNTRNPAQYSILIDEFQTQSYSSNLGKFHFTSLCADGSFIDHRYRAYFNGSNDGYYWFKQPFQSIDSITISVYRMSDGVITAVSANVVFHLQLVYLDEETDDA